jgi:hypothetical protein
MNREERAAYQRAWRAKNGARTGRAGPKLSAVCGTRSGRNRHYKEGTPVCDACRQAEMDQKRAWRSVRRNG